MLALFLMAMNACGVVWDPVAVLPSEARAKVQNSRVVAPCRVASLTEPLRAHFATELVNERPRRIPGVGIADPDGEWNSGCALVKGKANRQLVAAAQAGSRWIIHFRQGGIAIREFVVILEESGDGVHELWRGTCEDDWRDSRSTHSRGAASRKCRTADK